MSRKIRKIKKANLEAFIDRLGELPPKEQSVFNARQAVAKAAPQLRELLSKGYGYDDLVKLLRSSGIKIQRNTLQQYLRDAKKTHSADQRDAETAAPETLSVEKNNFHSPAPAIRTTPVSSSKFLEMDEDL